MQPGQFVTETAIVVEVWPAGKLDDGNLGALRRAVEIESERDLEQDAGYGIRQLTDIALRALSPGINDPSTAVTCIGYLQAVLERLAEREFPAAARELDDRDVELVAEQTSFEDYAESAFGELGIYAADNVRVAGALLEAYAEVAACARRAAAPERAATLATLARQTAQLALEQAGTDADRATVAGLLENIERAAA